MQRWAGRKTRAASAIALFLASTGAATFSGESVKPAQASGPAYSLSVANTSVVEGNTKVRHLYFTVSLSRPSPVPVSVQYVLTAYGQITSGKCSVVGSDFYGYAGAARTLSFPVGASGSTAASKTTAVAVCPDAVQEIDEYVRVTLFNATAGFVIGKSFALGTITDDDSGGVTGPQVSIGDASVFEGDAGNRTATFEVDLSQPAATAVTAYYVVTSGTATCEAVSSTGVPAGPDTDCSNLSGAIKAVTIPKGAIEKTITDVVVPDSAYEGDETFSVQLVAASGATINRATGIGTINNDDTACNNGQAAPAQYQSVVVIAFENRTWAGVGGQGFQSNYMPYLRGLAQSCSYFTSWSEANAAQNSMTQYTSQITGAFQPNLTNNCQPSTCTTTADNIFRQARTAGKTAIDYVEGAPTGCTASVDFTDKTEAWVQFVPAMYMAGAGDAQNCTAQVRPMSEFDPNNLPNFSFLSLNACDGGHDYNTCGGNDAVDRFAALYVEQILESPAYKHGSVAIFIWYDEDDPVPNLEIAPTARPGPFSTSGVGYASTLSAWESMLGLPCLANACTATDMRTIAGV